MSTRRSIFFLTVEDVLELHFDQITRYGGDPGVRDIGLVDSAVALPRQMFAGEYLHTFPVEMAAAYLFHITSNHGFVDGNKRTGLAAALNFLALNAVKFRASQESVENLVMGIAEGRISKAQTVAFFNEHVG